MDSSRKCLVRSGIEEENNLIITKFSENYSSQSFPDWDTDDDLELEWYQQDQEEDGDQAAMSSSSSNRVPGVVDRYVSMGFDENLVIQALEENDAEDFNAVMNFLLSAPVSALAEISSTSSSRKPRLIDQYVAMGFDENNVIRALEKNDEEDTDAIMQFLLSAPAVRASTSSSREIGVIEGFIAMGFNEKMVIRALKENDAKDTDAILNWLLSSREQTVGVAAPKKRKSVGSSFRSIERPQTLLQRDGFGGSVRLPNKMIGFGVPGCSMRVTTRKLPNGISDPPYFYYENVACTPKGVWETISRFLYDIEPEFVDSIHFSAAARKRGYIHNLPLKDRQPLLPIPPKTIHEALPETKRWWPVWDTREKLNCLLTCIGSAQLNERIRKRVESGVPSADDIKYVLKQCKKWNLVWVGKNKVAVLEPTDMEMLLGFPKDYTRGVSRTDRYKGLGNTFQIDTVAYHLSVLKPLYPQGMRVLSLFSGIGGAEIALYRLGIPMNIVVSVEISEANRKIVQDWWEETEQKGQLIHVDDVQKVDYEMISNWVQEFGGFDLVIGGSPCNNLAGGNRRTRDGLQGEHSSLFFQYYRILELVRNMMRGI